LVPTNEKYANLLNDKESVDFKLLHEFIQKYSNTLQMNDPLLITLTDQIYETLSEDVKLKENSVSKKLEAIRKIIIDQ
jgi:hypothetical protein